MKVAYPASNASGRLNETQLALKIARHSSCRACNTCTGLNPPPGADVVFDESTNETLLGHLEQYGSDDDDADAPYLETCACGHTVGQHGADPFEVDSAEFARRSRVAIRLDEILQVSICS